MLPGTPSSPTSALRRLASLLLLLAVTLSCGRGGPSDSPATQGAAELPPDTRRFDPYSAPLHASAVPTPAKTFDIDLLDGTPFSLQAQQGRVVLLNIWATWCAPCLRETPDLVALDQAYRDSGLTVLGVSVDEQGESVVLPFLRRFDVQYPIYIDRDEIVMDRYGPTMGIPTTYLIDTQGRLRYFAVGAVTRAELEPRIREMLALDAAPDAARP